VEPELELDKKLCILFPSFNIFSFTFNNKFVEIYKLFLEKQLTRKGKKISNFFFGKFCFLWSRYGAGTGTETVKNSYGSTTLSKSPCVVGKRIRNFPVLWGTSGSVF